MRMRRPQLLPAVILSAALLAGCAADDDVEELDAELEQLDDDAGDGEPVDPEDAEESPDAADGGADETEDGDGGSAVAIRDNAFEPGSLEIGVGDTVTWTHEGSRGHNVTADEFESGGLASGEVFEFTFEEAGTYAYVCTIHQGMSGEVVVG